MGWDQDLLALTIDSLERLADDAGKHQLPAVHDSALDLYVYLSGLHEQQAPSLTHSEVFDRLTEQLANSLSKYLPQGTETVRYIGVLMQESETPAALIKAFETRGFRLRSFKDTQSLAELLARTPASALLVTVSQVQTVCQMIDTLSKQVPANGSTVVIAIGEGGSNSRLQAMLHGAELFFESLDDLKLVSRVLDVIERSIEEPYRVMIVDDDTGTRIYLRLVLEQAGMTVLECADPNAVLEQIASFQPDLLLMDLYMKGLDGLSLTMHLRQQPKLSVLPIVFISVEQEDETRFRAIQAGGDDFLTKPIRPRILIAEVRSRIKRMRMVKRRALLSTALPSSSGQLRRGDFLRQLATALRRPLKPWHALLAVKIDQADELGKLLGLAEAFALEETVMQWFDEILRQNDAYTTWLEFGFGILLRRKNHEEVIEVAEALRKKISGEVFRMHGHEHKLTLSIGIALPPNGVDADDADRWVASACCAQSIAHRQGGDRHDGVLTREHGAMPPERVMMIRERVREAATGQNIIIDFQPMLPLYKGQVGLYSLDAKLRDSRLPLQGVGRGEYLALAREAGALPMIERIGLFNAFEAIEVERSKGRNTRILVSLDLASVTEAQMNWLQTELRRRKSYADGLLIELDATSLLEHPEYDDLLQRLKSFGVSIVVSDNAAGLSRIEALLEFPVNMLRLPFSAIHNMPATIFMAFVRPWYKSGRSLIIDQVENTDALAQLWALEVAYLHGDVLAASGPRLDYPFAEYSVNEDNFASRLGAG
ncbi:MAG: response regulator [Arenimonas sp.]